MRDSINLKITPQSKKESIFIYADYESFSKHNSSSKVKKITHFENSERIKRIEEVLKEQLLMTDSNTCKPRNAKQKEIELCHDTNYMKKLKDQIQSITESETVDFKGRPRGRPKKSSKNRPIVGDFTITKNCYENYTKAVGAGLNAVEDVLNLKTKRAFCIIRPPGHHAHAHTGSGFCVFNNVAIAAKYLANKEIRTLIVDWDLHHGDGTQELVKNNKNIFYFSTHKSTDHDFYPGLGWGLREDQGEYNNVMNRPITGTSPRLKIFQAFEELKFRMESFQPQFVLISAGFDGHKDEVIEGGGLGLESEDYDLLTKFVVIIANSHAEGRIVSLLEGGYNVDATAQAVAKHVRALQYQEGQDYINKISNELQDHLDRLNGTSDPSIRSNNSTFESSSEKLTDETAIQSQSSLTDVKPLTKRGLEDKLNPKAKRNKVKYRFRNEKS